MTSQFSELSFEVTKTLSKKEKQDSGFFVTPRVIIEKLFDVVNKHLTTVPVDIIEPSCGTCEIVNYCDAVFENANIDAVELNTTVYKSIQGLSFKNKVALINADFMTIPINRKKYDLLVANPPYFVCEKAYVPGVYKEYINGRPNIFGLFILHSIQIVKPGGVLAFVLPKSFMNSVYYAKIRNFVKETCEIIEIIDFEADKKFIDTEQSTVGLVLRKIDVDKSNAVCDCDYSIKIGKHFIFTTDGPLLNKIFEGATTIESIGLSVRTGQIVWNQHKDILTPDSNNTLLVYNTNLTNDNKIEAGTFKNNEKFQYIKREGKCEPIIVVNRGNGNSKYNLKYSVVNTDKPYLIENHLNEIYSVTNINKKKLLELFDKITTSFEDPRTQQFIDLYLGNNGLSKTELETIFPIYL
jgi:adenine-specific DNA-methyltransferase